MEAIKLTNEGRRSYVRRSMSLSVLSNVVSKLLSVILVFLSIKLTLPYLGVDRFGLWMLILSFSGFLMFLDLGVGNALTNRVAEHKVKNDIEKIVSTVTGGLGILFIQSLLSIIFLTLVSMNIPWGYFLKTQAQEILAEARVSAIYFSVIVGLNLVSSGLQRIFAGMQELYIANIFGLLGTLLAYIGLWYAVQHKLDVPGLIGLTLGIQVISMLFLLIILIKRGYFIIGNLFVAINEEHKELIKIGMRFLFVQLGLVVALGVDGLIVGSCLGAASVATYSIAQRLFSLITIPMGVMNAPLWAAYANANTNNDYEFIRSTLAKSLLITVMYSLIASIIIVIFAPEMIEIWLSNQLIVNKEILILFALWSMCEVVGNAFSMFLNGIELLRPQVFISLLLILIMVPIKYASVNVFGINGILCSSVITYLLIYAFVLGYLYKNEIRKFLG